MRKTYFLILCEVFFLTIFLGHILLYPNIPAYVTQLGRQSHGLSALINPNDTALIAFVNESITAGKNPLEAYSQIPYKTDYSTSWNVEYWKTPSEFLKDNGGDCEDQSVFLASLLENMKAQGLIGVQNVSVVEQPTHAYTSVDNQTIGYQPPATTGIFTNIENILSQMPYPRVFLLGVGMTLIVLTGYRKLCLLNSQA
jgi:hypothetical protein